MYVKNSKTTVEAVSYEETHIQSVLDVIRKNFDSVFPRFLESQAGLFLTGKQFDGLRRKMGVQTRGKDSMKDPSENYKCIIRFAIEEFEHDRDSYALIMDKDALEEYEEDPYIFKTRVLKSWCPVIRKTLANQRARELDKYRADFSRADADGLLAVVTRLCNFADNYVANVYQADAYEKTGSYKDLQLSLLDTADYTYFGVIGGGIKSMMLYKTNPMVFPSRSRNAVWALWYLSDQLNFGCKEDSEFLMINQVKAIAQQNYYYPYELFAYYAFEIYRMLQDKAKKLNAYIDPAYRYVVVDAFFNYVAFEHQEHIRLLSTQLAEDRGYCCA